MPGNLSGIGEGSTPSWLWLVCGPSGWTTLLGPKNKGVGQAANILTAYIGMSLCLTGGPTSPGCIGYVVYTIANDLFSLLWDWLGPKPFHGSLSPRPSVPNQTDINETLGVPINEHNRDRQTSQSQEGVLPSPIPLRFPGTSY